MDVRLSKTSFQPGHKTDDVTVTVSGSDAPNLLVYKFKDKGKYKKSGSADSDWDITQYHALSSTEATVSITPPAGERGGTTAAPTGDLTITAQDGANSQPLPAVPVALN